ncbi:MAG: DJ-1/PfpI family protein [Candidatus Hydrogenedentes bacterium]|nr:DJ-1/PfpI family protein [Candidatus Hydrogenedentota bacterium]
MVSTFINATAEEKAVPEKKAPLTLGVLVFPGFELLDAMGPLEMFGNVGPELKVLLVAEAAGEVPSSQKVKVVADYGFADCPALDIIMVPGGFGALQVLGNETILSFLRDRSAKAQLTTSVCNGSQILAAAGILDGKRATTNKAYYSQITAPMTKVNWVKEARWVEDGNIITSSGVSAGMDMALAVIARLFGNERAEAIAQNTEYTWHKDANVDPFAQFAR